MTRLAVVLGLALTVSACEFDQALRQYCSDRPELCTCDAAGQCCLPEGARCDGEPCCGGLVCSLDTNTCVERPLPSLSANPWAVVLEASDVGLESEPVTVVVQNHSAYATGPLVLELGGLATHLRVASDSCTGRRLERGAPCEVTLLLRAAQLGRHTGIVRVFDESVRVEIGVSATAGVMVALRVTGDGAAGGRIDTPDGSTCIEACTAWVPRTGVSRFTARALPGASFVSWSGVPGCGASADCDATPGEGATLEAAFEGWLQLSVTGELDGRLEVLMTGTRDCGRGCGVVVDGTVVIRAVSLGSVVSAWSGACAPAGNSSDCTVTVTGRTEAGANFVRAP